MSNTLFYMLLQYRPNFCCASTAMRCDMHDPRQPSPTLHYHHHFATRNLFVVIHRRRLIAMVCMRMRLPENAARFIMKMLNINHQQNNKLNGILKRGNLIQSGMHIYVCTFTSFGYARVSKKSMYTRLCPTPPSYIKWCETLFSTHTAHRRSLIINKYPLLWLCLSLFNGVQHDLMAYTNSILFSVNQLIISDAKRKRLNYKRTKNKTSQAKRNNLFVEWWNIQTTESEKENIITTKSVS